MEETTRHEAELITRNPAPFARTSRRLTSWLGSPQWVLVLGSFLAVWLAVGAAWDFPRWWELAITIGLPSLTLLLLAVIQHTQNHESNAIELKLDELLSALDPASDAMVRIEEAGEEELERLQDHFGEQPKKARSASSGAGPGSS